MDHLSIFLIPQLVLDAFYGMDNKRNYYVFYGRDNTNAKLDNIARINLQEFAQYMINTIKKIDDAEYFLVVGDTGDVIYDKHLMSNFGRIYGLKSRIMFKTQGNNMYNPIFALNGKQYTLHRLAWIVFKRLISKNKFVHWTDSADKKKHRLVNSH
jgi:hypothetical protein